MRLFISVISSFIPKKHIYRDHAYSKMTLIMKHLWIPCIALEIKSLHNLQILIFVFYIMWGTRRDTKLFYKMTDIFISGFIKRIFLFSYLHIWSYLPYSYWRCYIASYWNKRKRNEGRYNLYQVIPGMA